MTDLTEQPVKTNAVILLGDVRERLADLPDASVHCCVTSPPYWGLRDYGQDGQIGLEASPAEYVANMVDVFREVRRVLRDDGVLWLNLGDSYNGTTMNRTGQNGFNDGRTNRDKRFSVGGVEGLKPKDLVGIPWRVALALQDDGWYLRQDIIWHKPNPMPESVTDRCTKAHEYLFMLTKSPRYFYDHRAVQEPSATGSWDKMPPIGGNKHATGNANHTYSGNQPANDGMRNKRSVWTIATKPFKGAHFAVMPEALVDPCIRASVSLHGCCASCHAPYKRQLEWGEAPDRTPRENLLNVIPGRDKPSRLQSQAMEKRQSVTVGWQKTCTCDTDEITSSTVLDPFTGAGTVAVVALRHNADFVGTELNPDYIKIAVDRISSDQPMFNNVTVK